MGIKEFCGTCLIVGILFFLMIVLGLAGYSNSFQTVFGYLVCLGLCIGGAALVLVIFGSKRAGRVFEFIVYLLAP